MSEMGKHGQQAGKGLHILKEQLKLAPEIGLGLCCQTLNTVSRGARLGKLYIRSASSGVGKSRLSLADACYLAMDEIYDIQLKKWKPNNKAEPTLFITTELGMDEIQTMILAFVTGINEEKIQTFQQISEEFAALIIPKVWEREQRKVSRVATRLSISPKKVRRALRRAGILEHREEAGETEAAGE
jgi:replicative DNA helicase